MRKSKFFYKIFVLLGILLLIACAVYFILSYFNIDQDKKGLNATALSSSDVVTTIEDWNLGSLSNITNTNGAISIDNKVAGYTALDVSEIYTAVSAESNTENAYLAVDDSMETYWSASCPDWETPCPAWQLDLGAIYNITGFKLEHGGVAAIRASENGVDWNNFGTAAFGPDDWTSVVAGIAQSARYIKIIEDGGFDVVFTEFELFESGAQATHTTAATQIDGQEGSADKKVIEWTSFTPTQTTPANTSISYEFRTSDDGSSWTSWSAPQAYSGSPLDLTTLTPNRYLQVRATLTNTDGASTPQIDDYTINFHNNQKPNKPTAQTAVIGN